MYLLKLIGLAIAAIVAVALIVALFVDREYVIERKMAIARPADSVYGYVRFLQHQNDYSKWASMDPGMKKEFRGTDAQPGFVSAWKSEKKDVGAGEQSIKAIDDSKRRVDYDIHFIEPMEGHAESWMQVQPEGGGSNVSWGIKGRMPYPFNLMLVLTSMKDKIGNDLSIGLSNLKTRMEAIR